MKLNRMSESKKKRKEYEVLTYSGAETERDETVFFYQAFW